MPKGRLVKTHWVNLLWHWELPWRLRLELCLANILSQIKLVVESRRSLARSPSSLDEVVDLRGISTVLEVDRVKRRCAHPTVSPSSLLRLVSVSVFRAN